MILRRLPGNNLFEPNLARVKHSCCFRCLKDLEVPHFHHELVYEAVVMVIESSHEKTEEAMVKLLQSLFRSFVITIEQMRAGFQRCFDQMVDISIDVPQAYIILERWVLRCRQVSFYTVHTVQLLVFSELRSHLQLTILRILCNCFVYLTFHLSNLYKNAPMLHVMENSNTWEHFFGTPCQY